MKTNLLVLLGLWLAGSNFATKAQPAAGLESSGNVDGVLTWNCGTLEPGKSFREVVLFVYDDSAKAAAQRLEVARAAFGQLPDPLATETSASASSTVWITNDTTDFALEGPCFFRWRSQRQSLKCAHGGQLSQFAYYVHYEDAEGEHRAGVINHGPEESENLRVVEPVRALGPTQAAGTVETADQKLRLRVRAVMGQGSIVAVEFVLTNLHRAPLTNVRLSTYANLEAAHTHEGDYSILDARTGGVLVFDPPTGMVALMAGLNPPATGYVATWNTMPKARAAEGISRERWKPFDGLPAEVEKNLFGDRLAAQGIYLPYVIEKTTTPETRTLTPDEATDALHRDWLFQAMKRPLSERARAEIGWARALAARLTNDARTPSLARELAELDELEKRLDALTRVRPRSAGPESRSGNEPDSAETNLGTTISTRRAPSPLNGERAGVRGEANRKRDHSPSFPIASQKSQIDPDLAASPATDLYFSVRAVKRRIAFKNPLLDFTQLLFIDQPMPRGRVNPEHEAIHRMGITATPGGRLLVLDGLHPGGKVRQLAPDKPGSFWRPDLSFDGQRVLFCFKPHDEKSFHLYEMNLDGTGLRQLTSSDYDDVDPIYLPDGHILFTTTRGNSHVRCGPFIYSYILARCDADGRNVYLISCNGEPDFVPALLNDGRVIYSRWEYSDKALWRVQSLWTTRQDGTGTAVFWGNQSVWPDHLAEPRPIPGSRRVMFAGVGHHDWFSGSIGIVDPDKGLNFPHGLTKVTRELRWPECSLPPVDPGESEAYHAAGNFTGYKTPFPLSEKDFLVSARGEENKFRLYLMDVEGNRELIYEGAHNVWHALPVKARTPPPRHSDLVAWPGTGKDRRPSKPGVFFCNDVYEGVPDLPRGSVKFLRVFQLDYKTYTTWKKTYRHSGPAVSIVQEEGVKRILSEVPVESDGSAYFKVPPGRALFFQLLDEHRRCLQIMRSFAGLMPGEVRGCVGCHESHSAAPARNTGLASRRAPTELTPPPWGEESISYERFVQPVLDRYCGKCHQGDGDAEARKQLDLTLRPGVDVFKEPYLTLVGPAGWGNPFAKKNQPGCGIAGAIPVESMDPTMNNPAALATLRPKQFLSPASRLIELSMSGRHYDVKVDELSLRRLIAWVDACAPFMGEEEIRALDDPDFEGIAMLPIRPRVKTAPVVERP
ncbi:MAG: hypothetical protein HYY24_29905 [Verrucomicrobia bacterium]|nr:hypothetical protein [Verrucomicrobiota bacterium]